MVIYQFQVSNKGSKPVELRYSTPQMDTSVTLAAGNSAMILERSQVNRGVEPYFVDSDSIWWFKSLEASSDSTPTSRNLMVASTWTFSKKDKQTGLYLLELTDADF